MLFIGGSGLIKMDPALLKEREAFKKRSQATPVVEKKVSKAKVSLKDRPGGSSSKGKKKKSSGLSKLKPKRVIQTGVYILLGYTKHIQWKKSVLVEVSIRQRLSYTKETISVF